MNLINSDHRKWIPKILTKQTVHGFVSTKKLQRTPIDFGDLLEFGARATLSSFFQFLVLFSREGRRMGMPH